jgi:hypothetical protein
LNIDQICIVGFFYIKKLIPESGAGGQHKNWNERETPLFLETIQTFLKKPDPASTTRRAL